MDNVAETTEGRRFGLLTTLLGALAVVASLVGPAVAQPENPRMVAQQSAEITVMSTADLHAHALNWDYLANEPFSSGRGLARVSTLVDEVRAEREPDSTLLIDAGDTFQGTMLGHYYATVDRADADTPHPMATAMNAVGFDAMTVGNHDFNYTVPFLRELERQLDAPILGANVLDADTGKPALEPYLMKTVKLRGHKPIQVGILGLTTPGSALWDRSNVSGLLEFTDGIQTAHEYVPEMRAQGADVVIVAMHSGMRPGSSYGDQLPYLENFGRVVAEQVPGIDVIMPAHSHSTIDEQFITNEITGDEVLVTQPGSHGRLLSVADIQLRKVRGQWEVVGKSSDVLDADVVYDDPEIVDLVRDQHDVVVDYMNSPIATNQQELTLANSMVEDVAAIDFMAMVQAQVTREALEGTEYEGIPVVSGRSPLTRSPVTVPPGEVTVREIASLYYYSNNTLVAAKLTGAELLEFMEWVASHYEQVADAGPHTRDSVIRSGVNAQWFLHAIYGLEYDIDLTEPVGNRIVNPMFEGQPLDPDAEFILAADNYVMGGGGDPPVVTEAEVVYDPLVSIQQLIIDWAAAEGVIDADNFHSVDWQLVADGIPLTWSD